MHVETNLRTISTSFSSVIRIDLVFELIKKSFNKIRQKLLIVENEQLKRSIQWLYLSLIKTVNIVITRYMNKSKNQKIQSLFTQSYIIP
ncbi:hypothetical protein SteCoe_39641 [Stentor coeruleus]|uniref:Uncharacterized protein n=1 Tax=Stentor coeruleus TaxID=5963 RepID=A0A1R2AKI5_9CILI|nr:hypothetical protein SteCoe_39641 [Stentor coeruleus]